MAEPKSMEETYKNIVRRDLDAMIVRLDHLKRDLETYKRDVDTATSLASLASYVVSDFVWGTANMRLDALVSNAAEGDREIAREKYEKGLS